MCNPCKHPCITCSDDINCTSCSTEQENNRKPLQFGRCDCKEGFYDDGIN